MNEVYIETTNEVVPFGLSMVLSAMVLGSGNHGKYSQHINVFSYPDAESCRPVT